MQSGISILLREDLLYGLEMMSLIFDISVGHWTPCIVFSMIKNAFLISISFYCNAQSSPILIPVDIDKAIPRFE
jgi:hypothetical protein